MSSGLHIVPIFQSEAKAFIAKYHRHHKPPIGAVFCLAVACDGEIVGVCTVGRPVARKLQDGWTLEVNRLATDGTKNACSKLYAAAWRVAKNMGYRRLITYILDSEPGTTLKAAGWREVGRAGGVSWNVPSRPRVDKCPSQFKIRFEKVESYSFYPDVMPSCGCENLSSVDSHNSHICLDCGKEYQN